MSCELLACVSLVEAGSRWQEWTYEIENFVENPREVLQVSFQDFWPFDIVVDAHDLYDLLTKPAIGQQTDLQMTIYLNSVRFDIKAGRIRTRY